MAAPLKNVVLTAALLGALSSFSVAQQVSLPGIRIPMPTQPVRLPFPNIPARPLPSHFQNPALLPISVQPSILPAVAVPQALNSLIPAVIPTVVLPPVVVPAHPRVVEAPQMKPVRTRLAAAQLDKVFDGALAQRKPSAEPVDLREPEDIEKDSKPAERRVTLPEWELEQDLGIR
ncbi:MAG: hypothetical protein HY922_04845 [Elusimicrobia bacterium]|nr:hypothetical protein [Elusimicrobiota bacterium]